jgi:hypothetical protein
VMLRGSTFEGTEQGWYERMYTRVQDGALGHGDGPRHPENTGGHASHNRACAVLVSSADLPFEGDEKTFDPARPDAALHFNRRDRLELPALSSMLVEHVLELVAGHLAADHALTELDHRVFVAVRHTTTIAARPLDECQSERAPAGMVALPLMGTLRTRPGAPDGAYELRSVIPLLAIKACLGPYGLGRQQLVPGVRMAHGERA